MKVSAISQISGDDYDSRRNLFIRFSNSFMSSANIENPIDKTASINKPTKLGIENLEEFTIFPKEVKDGKSVIIA